MEVPDVQGQPQHNTEGAHHGIRVCSLPFPFPLLPRSLSTLVQVQLRAASCDKAPDPRSDALATVVPTGGMQSDRAAFTESIRQSSCYGPEASAGRMAHAYLLSLLGARFAHVDTVGQNRGSERPLSKLRLCLKTGSLLDATTGAQQTC